MLSADALLSSFHTFCFYFSLQLTIAHHVFFLPVPPDLWSSSLALWGTCPFHLSQTCVQLACASVLGLFAWLFCGLPVVFARLQPAVVHLPLVVAVVLRLHSRYPLPVSHLVPPEGVSRPTTSELGH